MQSTASYLNYCQIQLAMNQLRILYTKSVDLSYLVSQPEEAQQFLTKIVEFPCVGHFITIFLDQCHPTLRDGVTLHSQNIKYKIFIFSSYSI